MIRTTLLAGLLCVPLASVTACGGDDEPGGSAGTSGVGASAGTGGTAGSGATGGTGGSGGTIVDTSCLITGTTYYLDAANGLDANDGSSAAPWQSIAHAQTVLAAGDGVRLRDGEYGEFVHDNTAHTEWVTYRADDGHHPVLTGITIDNDGAADAYLRFCGLAVQHPEPDPWPPDDGLRHSVGQVLNIEEAHHVEVIDCTFRGVDKYLSAGIRLHDSDQVTIHHCDVSVVKGGVHAVNCNDFVLSYNHVHTMSEGSGIRFQGDVIGTIIVGNHVHGQHGDPSEAYFPYQDQNEWHVGSGISIRISNAVIRNNIIHDGFSQGMMFYVDGQPDELYENMLVENNLFYDTGRIHLYQCGTGIVVRNNTFVSEVRVDGTDKYDILQRYSGGAYFTLAYADGHDGAGIELTNNVFVDPGLYTAEASGGPDAGQTWDYDLALGSPAINAGDPARQPPDSLGSVDADGFILNDGPVRNADQHSLGAYE